MIRKNTGITLISLVISIIVIIILANVTINTLINNGIIDKAKTATQEYKNAQDYEETQIAKYSNEMDSKIDSSRETVTISKEDYDKLVEDVSELKQSHNINSSSFSVISNRIKGNKCYLNTIGNLVQIEINGDAGSQNIGANQVVKLASGLPKCASSIQELSIVMDNPDLYARSWIDSNGDLFIYQSGVNYTGNIFIGGTYIKSE